MKKRIYPLEQIAEIKKRRLEEAEKVLREKRHALDTADKDLKTKSSSWFSIFLAKLSPNRSRAFAILETSTTSVPTP